MSDQLHDPKSDDRALLASGLGGDAEALDVLFARYRRLLYSLACRVLGNREEAEDVVQNCYLQAFSKIRQFNNEGTFRSWLVRILVNEAITARRKRKSKPAAVANRVSGSEPEETVDRLPDAGCNPEQALVKKELVGALAREVSRLSKPLRSVVLLCALKEYSTEEAGAKLCVPHSTIRSRLFRARKRLAATLALVECEDCGEPSSTGVSR